MMKYVFILVLGLVAATAGLMGLVVALRFVDNMTQTPVITTGERVFPMPTGVVARGGTLILPREQREVAAKIANPLKPTPESIALGRERYVTFCAPCHGPELKGGVSGPVSTKFVPTPDLTNAQLQAGRTDGYWHSYIMAGGAVMPSYGEAMSSDEAWHIVNFVRSAAAK
jgi:mono/diheme cytochrome c family protein